MLFHSAKPSFESTNKDHLQCCLLKTVVKATSLCPIKHQSAIGQQLSLLSRSWLQTNLGASELQPSTSCAPSHRAPLGWTAAAPDPAKGARDSDTEHQGCHAPQRAETWLTWQKLCTEKQSQTSTWAREICKTVPPDFLGHTFAGQLGDVKPHF